MTVQYYHEVLTVGPLTFLRLLRRWRGSVLKLIYKDGIIFSLLFVGLSCLHQFGLTKNQKTNFEEVVKYVSSLQSTKSIALGLGFYVAIVFQRFWDHFNTVPWITKIAMLIATHLNTGSGAEEHFDVMLQKRSIIRYLVAAQILTLSRVSVPVKRRFPNVVDLYDKGILLQHEANLIMETQQITMQPFLPISWCTAIIMKAYDQGRIINDPLLVDMIKEINRFRHQLHELFLLDHICIPLVYTQVVTIGVYAYFISALISEQFISDINGKSERFMVPIISEQFISDNNGTSVRFVVPIIGIIQFIVYMGWLKLALVLVNPMGDDDEDFDMNTVVDYNFEVGMAIVSQLDNCQPPFIKDKFLNQTEFTLPMEKSMKHAKSKPFMGSMYNLKVEDDYWMKSLHSIVTTNSDAIDNTILSHISLHNLLEVPLDDGHHRPLTRTGSIKSNHKHHTLHRQPSAASVIEPITEEENEENVGVNLPVEHGTERDSDMEISDRVALEGHEMGTLVEGYDEEPGDGKLDDTIV